MRLKDYDERDGKRVWLSESEIGLLFEHTDPDHVEMEIAFTLAARCGLRRDEAAAVTPADPDRARVGREGVEVPRGARALGADTARARPRARAR